MTDITWIVELIFTLLGLVITAFVIPWLRQKISAGKLAEIEHWVGIAVKAAEMIYVGSGRGEEKKAYVLQFLNDKGYTIDLDRIENMIESAVLDLQENKE